MDGEVMSDAQQNFIDNLRMRRHELEIRLNALQADAKRYAFESVVNGSWKARQDFRDVMQAADQLSDEIGMIDLATTEAYERLQSRGRDVSTVLKELFGGAEI
jgi:hypothetical protein